MKRQLHTWRTAAQLNRAISQTSEDIWVTNTEERNAFHRTRMTVYTVDVSYSSKNKLLIFNTKHTILTPTGVNPCQCKYFPVKYIVIFLLQTSEQRCISDFRTGGISRSKVVSLLTLATFVFDRDALSAHLCFLYFTLCSDFWWAFGSISLAQTETKMFFMWKVEAVWEV